MSPPSTSYDDNSSHYVNVNVSTSINKYDAVDELSDQVHTQQSVQPLQINSNKLDTTSDHSPLLQHQSAISPDDGELPTHSLNDAYSTVAVADSSAPWYKKLWAYSGIGIMVAVGYTDPGNWATDLIGGSKFNYTLLFVILLSNIAAIQLQYLALKLGIATERDLAQSCKDQYSKQITIILWILAEISIAACDLAEVLGSAIALEMLFNIPLSIGCVITGLDVLLILLLESQHIRYLEFVVGFITCIIASCFTYELTQTNVIFGDVMSGFIPSIDLLTNTDKLLVSLSLLGATVMPHNLYLHSSLIQTRSYERTVSGKHEAIKYATIDSTLSLFIAFIINCMILVLSAAAFYGTSNSSAINLTDAYQLLSPSLGSTAASTLFAVALLSSGQNSTITGTLAGQIIIEGFLTFKMKPWLRRIITRGIAIVPACIVAAVAGDTGVNTLLIISQLILSLQLGFAVIPLVKFTSDSKLMTNEYVNSRITIFFGTFISICIVCLNIFLVLMTITGNA